MDKYAERKKELQAYYEALRLKRQQELEGQKNRGLGALEEEKRQGEEDFHARADSLSTQFERSRRSFNEAAALRGLGTGLGTQAALEQRSAYLRGFGALQKGRTEALQKNGAAAAELRDKYARLSREAGEDTEAELKKALLDEEKQHMSELMERARTLAKYGDFSAYGELYGPETAEKMHETWLKQNPLLAYKMGEMSAGEYKSLTGRNPPGVRSGGYGGRKRKEKSPGISKKAENPKLKDGSRVDFPRRKEPLGRIDLPR